MGRRVVSRCRAGCVSVRAEASLGARGGPGGIVFAVSGPILSTASDPNNSEAAALIPWVLWALDLVAERASARRVALLAVMFALELFAGEPVTLAACAALAVAYAVFGADSDGRKNAVRLGAITMGAGLLGFLLAAPQALPLVDATSRSPRGHLTTGTAYSLSPVRLVETVAPDLFGSALDPSGDISSWMVAVSDGRDPYLFSIYVGVTALALASFGAVAGKARRWALFWTGAFVVALVFTLGDDTPIYRTLCEVVPPLRVFRYPSKYAYETTLALAVLAAAGWDALPGFASKGDRRRLAVPIAVAGGLAFVGALAAVVAAVAPSMLAPSFARLAATLNVDDTAEAASWLVDRLLVAGPRLFALGLATAACIWLASAARPEARYGRVALFAGGRARSARLVLGGESDPRRQTLSRAGLVAITRAHPTDRVFVAQKTLTGDDPARGAPPEMDIPKDVSLVAGLAVYTGVFPNMPTGIGVRESMSIDLVFIRPVEYNWATSAFVAGRSRGSSPIPSDARASGITSNPRHRRIRGS